MRLIFDLIRRVRPETADQTCKKLARPQFIRFLVVGIGNTIFSYLLYAGFILLGLDYRIASLTALVFGIGVSFTTQGILVFQNANRTTLVRFIGAWILIYSLNIYIISRMINISFNEYLAGAIATIPVTLASYFILKYFVFRRHAKDDSSQRLS